MATVQPPQRLTFLPESLDFRDEVRERLSRRMRELALERARLERRDSVTEEDFKATMARAVREIMAEFGVNAD